MPVANKSKSEHECNETPVVTVTETEDPPTSTTKHHATHLRSVADDMEAAGCSEGVDEMRAAADVLDPP